jgi:hypothetical protein
MKSQPKGKRRRHEETRERERDKERKLETLELSSVRLAVFK